ncbi:hypothetical protein DFH06DRAFT_1130474 [Mycena polygramma]|nr:hypothetical protein DFH06DRAFT_1130474 [Mycena polygramma]
MSVAAAWLRAQVAFLEIHSLSKHVPSQACRVPRSAGKGKSKLNRRDRFKTDSALDSGSILGAESIKNRLSFDRSDSHSQSGYDSLAILGRFCSKGYVGAFFCAFEQLPGYTGGSFVFHVIFLSLLSQSSSSGGGTPILRFDRFSTDSASRDVRIGAEAARESASEFNFDFPYYIQSTYPAGGPYKEHTGTVPTYMSLIHDTLQSFYVSHRYEQDGATLTIICHCLFIRRFSK